MGPAILNAYKVVTNNLLRTDLFVACDTVKNLIL
jgi:hypothetical protein